MYVDQVYCQLHDYKDIADHKFTSIFLVEHCPPKEYSTDAHIGPKDPSEAIEVAEDESQDCNKNPEENVIGALDLLWKTDVDHFIEHLEVEEPFDQARPLEAGCEIEHACYPLHHG